MRNKACSFQTGEMFAQALPAFSGWSSCHISSGIDQTREVSSPSEQVSTLYVTYMYRTRRFPVLPFASQALSVLKVPRVGSWTFLPGSTHSLPAPPPHQTPPHSSPTYSVSRSDNFPQHPQRHLRSGEHKSKPASRLCLPLRIALFLAANLYCSTVINSDENLRDFSLQDV